MNPSWLPGSATTFLLADPFPPVQAWRLTILNYQKSMHPAGPCAITSTREASQPTIAPRSGRRADSVTPSGCSCPSSRGLQMKHRRSELCTLPPPRGSPHGPLPRPPRPPAAIRRDGNEAPHPVGRLAGGGRDSLSGPFVHRSVRAVRDSSLEELDAQDSTQPCRRTGPRAMVRDEEQSATVVDPPKQESDLLFIEGRLVRVGAGFVIVSPVGDGNDKEVALREPAPGDITRGLLDSGTIPA